LVGDSGFSFTTFFFCSAGLCWVSTFLSESFLVLSLVYVDCETTSFFSNFFKLTLSILSVFCLTAYFTDFCVIFIFPVLRSDVWTKFDGSVLISTITSTVFSYFWLAFSFTSSSAFFYCSISAFYLASASALAFFSASALAFYSASVLALCSASAFAFTAYALASAFYLA